eukprot:jgi/Orpsp1_1/1184544/evm.model.c7180000089966.1
MSLENIISIKSTDYLLEKNEENEEIKKISYFKIFKYASITEKLMIAIGLLGSFTDGFTSPLMVEVISKVYMLFVKLVNTIYVRDLLDIHNNDEAILEFFDVLSRDDEKEITEFMNLNEEFNKKSTIENIKNSNMTTESFLDYSSQFIT